jgi:potassium-transporting ATPase KdpC subunit
MRRDVLIAGRAIVVVTVLVGLIYPLAMTGIAQVILPGKANGSLIRRNGAVVGSALIGQAFAQPLTSHATAVLSKAGCPIWHVDKRYFQTRPSGTGAPYEDAGTLDNAAATTFSNLGPNSTVTLAIYKCNIAAYRALERPYDPGLTVAKIPVDAINSSASGVDPDISVANALIQAHRVAAVRRLSLNAVDALVSRYTTGRSLGFLGEPGVNVLELNLALDRLAGRS